MAIRLYHGTGPLPGPLFYGNGHGPGLRAAKFDPVTTVKMTAMTVIKIKT